MDAARSISSAARQSSGWVTLPACHGGVAPSGGSGRRRALEALAALAVLLVAVAVAAGPAHGADRTTADSVSCPATLDGVPLSSAEEFAGTPRALANDEGILVRYTLLCPYDRPDGEPLADLTLAWSRYDADDLNCETVELTSEPAGDGRIQGLIDHPSLSARVTYGAASEAVLPAVDEAATQLLAQVPGDTYPCVGGEATGVDASLTTPAPARSSSVPLVLVVLLLAATAAVAMLVVHLARRARRRHREVTAPAPASSAGELAAALRAQRLAAAGGGDLGGEGPPGSGVAIVTGEGPAELGAERRRVAESLSRAERRQTDIEQGLSEARADLDMHRAHTDAVRRLAISVAAERDHPEFLASYAGVMALAVAATNLVATSARRAAILAAAGPTSGAGVGAEGGAEHLRARAAALDDLHRRVVVAAETGLDDSRYWLWQDRRLAVVAALAALDDLAPRLVAVQLRLTERVGVLAEHHETARREAERARSTIDDLDRRAAEAAATPLEGAGV